MEYLMTFPSNINGIGELYEEKMYEKVIFYGPKRNRNKSFI